MGSLRHKDEEGNIALSHDYAHQLQYLTNNSYNANIDNRIISERSKCRRSCDELKANTHVNLWQDSTSNKE